MKPACKHSKTGADRIDPRRSTFRRQVNESFCDATGQIAIAKIIALTGQIMLVFYTGRYFEAMLTKADTLLICLGFIIMPDVVKKLITMKYGNGHAPEK